jgi:S1-C subfamily serine protease
LAAGEKVEPPYLGVSPADNTPAIAKEYGISVSTGAIISAVTVGSPADMAGIRRFDVITEFGGATVTDSAGLLVLLDKQKPGDTVPVTLVRGTTVVQVQVTLGSRPVTPNS